MLLRSLTIVSLLLLAGCAALRTGEEQAPEAESPAAAAPLGADEVLSRLTALPAQELQAGSCGLFLWLRREDLPLIFFQRSNENAASMVLDGTQQTLPRTSVGQLIAFNFYDEQAFANDSFELRVRIIPEASRSIRQGIKVETGSLSITADDGWSASLPVAGLIGCQ